MNELSFIVLSLHATHSIHKVPMDIQTFLILQWVYEQRGHLFHT